MFRATAYSNDTGKTRRFGKHPTFREAEGALMEGHSPDNRNDDGSIPWNGPEHRGGQPGTWEAQADNGTWTLVIEQK